MDEAKKGKIMAELGLKEFKKVGIMFVVMVIYVTITQSHTGQLIEVANEGRCVLNTKYCNKEAILIK